MMNTTRVLLLNQHGYEDAGYFEEELSRRGHDFEQISRDEARWNELPGVGFSSVVLFGSVASPTEIDDPRFRGEADLLRRLISAGTPVVAVCFGAQVLAHVLGSPCFELGQTHFGFDQVDFDSDFVSGPQFFWHHYGFKPPPGAVELASSEEYSIAFTYGSALAVQFHPDANARVLSSWLKAGADEVVSLGHHQEDVLISATEVAAGVRKFVAQCVDWLEAPHR